MNKFDCKCPLQRTSTQNSNLSHWQCSENLDNIA